VLRSHLTSLKHDNIVYLVGQKFQVNKIILSYQLHRIIRLGKLSLWTYILHCDVKIQCNQLYNCWQLNLCYFSCSLCCEVSHSSVLIPENLVHLQEQTHSTNNKTWLAVIFWIVPRKNHYHIQSRANLIFNRVTLTIKPEFPERLAGLR